MSNISSNLQDKDVLTVAARRRVVQQGFIDSFVNRCNDLEYKIENQNDEDLNSDDLDGDLGNGIND